MFFFHDQISTKECTMCLILPVTVRMPGNWGSERAAVPVVICGNNWFDYDSH